MTNETERLIELVRVALDEFEDVSLAASLRRVLRIAQLRGDSEIAWHCRQDLRPIGGSRDMGRNEIRALWPTDTDLRTISAANHQFFENWIQEREIDLKTASASQLERDDGSGIMIAGSVAEIEVELALRAGTWRDEMDRLQHRAELDMRAAQDRTILDRIRYRAYAYLSKCETELALGGIASGVFDRHRRRVDATLSAIAPDVLEQLTAAHRRSAEGDREALTHALTSCRRALKAIADLVFPARAEPFVGVDGKDRAVGEEQYKNRLLAFLQDAPHQTSVGVLTSTIEDFANRIDSLNDLDSKGVHADVEQGEVDLCLTQTYLLAGEVLAIHAER